MMGVMDRLSSFSKTATFKVTDAGSSIKQSDRKLTVLFNPSDISVSIGHGYDHFRDLSDSEEQKPTVRYNKSYPREMRMTLRFDTYESHYEGIMKILPVNTMCAGDVNVEHKYISKLLKFSLPDENLGIPPHIRFKWGDIKFHGVITSMDYEYTMFSANGVPVRAVANIVMTETPVPEETGLLSSVENSVVEDTVIGEMAEAISESIADTTASATATSAVATNTAEDKAFKFMGRPPHINFEETRTKYNNYADPVCVIQIKVGGTSKTIPCKEYAIDNIVVQQTTKIASGGCKIKVIDRRKQSKDISDEGLFKVGNLVEARLGYRSAGKPITMLVFSGFIGSCRYVYAPNAETCPYIMLECYDAVALMGVNVEAEARNQDKTYVDTIESIVKKYEACGCTYRSSASLNLLPKLTEIPIRSFQSDLEYIEMICKKINYEFFIVKGFVYFRPVRKADSGPLLNWEKDRELLDVEIETNLIGQIAEVQLNYINEKSEGKSEKVDKTARVGSGNFASSISLLKNIKKCMYDVSISDKKAIEEVAKGEFDRISMKYRSGKITCIGLPELQAGTFISIKGGGEFIDNMYYIVDLEHSINYSDENGESGTYTTTLEIGANVYGG